MQPALVYAYLAMARFVRSSEIELGARGRVQALRLRDMAQAHLENSLNIQWIDLGLAEAAMVLALFETSAHPQHDDAHADTALVLLDKIIETLRLTEIDAADHDTLDHSSGVPTVAQAPPLKRCECTSNPNAAQTPAPADGTVTSSWAFQPAWDPNWSAEEIRAEETRRLCWSALVLVANHTVARAAEQREPLGLFLIDSSNVRAHFQCETKRIFNLILLLLSSGCSFRASITNTNSAENTALQRGRIRCGRCIAAACFCGTVRYASGMRVSRRRTVPGSLALRLWRRVWSRKLWTRTFATLIPRSSTCVGSSFQSEPHCPKKGGGHLSPCFIADCFPCVAHASR